MKTLIMISALLLLVSCGKDGQRGSMGADGRDGIDGAQGEQGETGAAGNNGTNSITKVVKFCPNLVDRYGVAYSEQGLCIEGKVYAVYSSNNLAALVELSPGQYSTTTPQGTNCSFVVDENTCN